MADRTYKIIELVGISEESFSDAVDNAIARADQTLNDLSWFEVEEERGSVSDGNVREYQVKVKVAFELD
ncbi:dodecin flavoprotein [Thermoplasmatales archaeon SW_10_69_26]|jgi:flavin-binding protein dodecin|nr:MAG: dodecin flavoprotein [Thermoplasmatales archaeon SW_10_69_26]